MVLAHGIGGAKDLPIPALYAVLGGGAALAVSFLVLALAWRSPRYDAATAGRPVPAVVGSVVSGTAFAATLRALGLAFTAYVGWAALAGPDLLTNPTFGVVYVLLWVGIVPLSVLFGPFYRAVNPLRTVHLLATRLTGGDPGRGLLRLPSWVGCWPAALGLLAFVWLELVYPHSTYLTPVRLWFAVYAAVLLVGAAVVGDEWFERADPFEVWSTLAGHLCMIGRRGTPGDGGPLVVRSPLAGLDGVPVVPGLVAVVAVLFGSTAFDSFKDTNRWLRFSQSVDIGSTWLDLAALLGFVAAVGVSLALATAPRPGRFAHSVVPIIVGYVVAHYLSYVVEVGQQTLVLLSDPLDRGWNLLGTAGWPVSYWISEHPTFLAVVKVLAVVTGHVVGVVAAHDRALRLLPPDRRLLGQLPLLVVMVAYTITGLSLLFGA
jgi:hypothetical protein